MNSLCACLFYSELHKNNQKQRLPDFKGSPGRAEAAVQLLALELPPGPLRLSPAATKDEARDAESWCPTEDMGLVLT